MKKLIITLIATMWVAIANAQNKKQLDSLKNECALRGHDLEDIGISTLAYCPPYNKYYPDSTVRVYPACNSTSVKCKRCKEAVMIKDKEYRIVIWRRKT